MLIILKSYYFSIFCSIIFWLILLFPISAKRLRLPMLLRSSKVECNSSSDTCVFSLQGFTVQRNTTDLLSGRRNFYHFEVQDYPSQPDPAKLKTFYFMTTSPATQFNSPGCLQVDYLVQGRDKFLFVITQHSESRPRHVVFRNWLGRNPNWSTAIAQVDLYSMEKETFMFEAICQYCSIGSSFSISRIELDWGKCSDNT